MPANTTATTTATTTSSSSSSSSPQTKQPSPLLSLAPELRLSIYAFALHHTASEIKQSSSSTSTSSFSSFSPFSPFSPSPPSSQSQPQRPAMRGALALLHTSTLLRSESSAAFESLLQLEEFQVQKQLGWKDLLGRANARVGSAGRGDLMEGVKEIVGRVRESLREGEGD